jgi:hypothetical protein
MRDGIRSERDGFHSGSAGQVPELPTRGSGKDVSRTGVVIFRNEDCLPREIFPSSYECDCG